jgi:hypothetical protein
LERGIRLPDTVTPLALSLALRRWLVPVEATSNPEYLVLARQAAVDTIAEWHQSKSVGQGRLFDEGIDPFESWRQSSRGQGFSDLSRTYFAKFTNRYLNYFLSRVASEKLETVDQRETFERALASHSSEIATHAFETSRIMQSLAAGWFNKNAIGEIPTDTEVQGFVTFALSKIREELRREGAEQ